jgi:CRP/FNR family transcriptional regulator, cyclic AMP receptor protein
MSTDRIASLKQIGLLSGLSEEELAALAPRCRWKSVRGGELIIGHRDQSHDVLFLLTGLARVNVYSVSGRQVSFRDIRPGDVVGELSAIDGAPRSASVESLVPSTFMVMPQAVFHDVVQSHPSVLFAALRHLTRQVRLLTERVFEFSTLAVRNRVHAELIRLAREHGGDDGAVIRPAPTHSEMANRISTHREAVTRELSRLEDLGIIARQGRTLRVNDLARLKAMVEDIEAD